VWCNNQVQSSGIGQCRTQTVERGSSHWSEDDLKTKQLAREGGIEMNGQVVETARTMVTTDDLRWQVNSVMTWLESMTRLESQAVTKDWSQSHFYKISKHLIDKHSLFAQKQMSFLASVMISIGANFLIWLRLLVHCSSTFLSSWDSWYTSVFVMEPH